MGLSPGPGRPFAFRFFRPQRAMSFSKFCAGTFPALPAPTLALAVPTSGYRLGHWVHDPTCQLCPRTLGKAGQATAARTTPPPPRPAPLSLSEAPAASPELVRRGPAVTGSLVTSSLSLPGRLPGAAGGHRLVPAASILGGGGWGGPGQGFAQPQKGEGGSCGLLALPVCNTHYPSDCAPV